MTYFDIKDVVFVNKIANCRKSAKEKVCACRGRRLDFWKISAGLPRKIQRSPNITEARQSFHICSKVHSRVPHDPVRGCITGIPMCLQTIEYESPTGIWKPHGHPSYRHASLDGDDTKRTDRIVRLFISAIPQTSTFLTAPLSLSPIRGSLRTYPIVSSYVLPSWN